MSQSPPAVRESRISRRRLARAAGAAFGLALAGRLAPRTARAGGATVRVGALYNQTGALSSIDLPGLSGMQLAAEQINARGGLLGRPLELVALDGRTQPAVVADAVRRMVEQYGVAAIGGLNDSDNAEAAGRAAQQLGAPFITAGATLPTLPATIGDDYFMACYGDDTQARAVADFARTRLGARSAWLLVDALSLYTTALARYFAQDFSGAGGRIAGDDTYGSGDRDFSTQIAHLQTLSPAPDVLFVAALPEEAGPITRALREAGFRQPILSGDGFDTPDLVEVAGPLADGVYYSTHVAYDNSAPLVQQFVVAYHAIYGTPPDSAFAALGYDTLNLIAAAITRAGSTDPRLVRDAIAATRGFAGVTGAISYAPGVRSPIKPVSIMAVEDGRVRFVELVGT